jgi:hypothetical protein
VNFVSTAQLALHELADGADKGGRSEVLHGRAAHGG